MYCICIFLELFDLTRQTTTDSPFPSFLPSLPPALQSFHSAPVAGVFICNRQGVRDQAGADGFVSVSQSEPLAFLQNHRLAERERQGGVLPGHHHFLKEDQNNGRVITGLQNPVVVLHCLQM